MDTHTLVLFLYVHSILISRGFREGTYVFFLLLPLVHMEVMNSMHLLLCGPAPKALTDPLSLFLLFYASNGIRKGQEEIQG